MRKMLNDVNKAREMTKNDIIETILFILRRILEYTSKLDQAIPSIFDKEEKENKNKNSDISTCESDINFDEKNDINCEEEKMSLAELIYYWTEKLNYDENLLFLMMMNLDKILNSKKVILNENNIENIVFTCMVITQKYYEDEGFNDKDYSKLKKIENNILTKMQMDYLDDINYSLLIKEEDLNAYKKRMKRFWVENMIYLLSG